MIKSEIILQSFFYSLYLSWIEVLEINELNQVIVIYKGKNPLFITFSIILASFKKFYYH